MYLYKYIYMYMHMCVQICIHVYCWSCSTLPSPPPCSRYTGAVSLSLSPSYPLLSIYIHV